MAIVLHHGDCLNIMQGFPDHSFDAIIADLPYGTTACKWDSVIPFEPLWKQYKRLIKKRGAIVLFGSQPFTSALVMSNVEWFKYCWVWEKDKGPNFGMVKYRPFNVSEDLVVFSATTAKYNAQMWDAGFITNKPSCVGEDVSQNVVYGKNGLKTTFRNSTDRYPRNVIRFPVPKHNDGKNDCSHPTQKPVALLEYLIRTYTDPGDKVLDNTMGSGTTMVACVNTGRDGVGIELYPLLGKPIHKTDNPDYFGIAQGRVEKAQNEMVQLELS